MIQVENVKKYYGERLIFADVTFKIAEGEKLGIVGANGAGKSTLLKIMMGAEPFDAGTIGGLRAEDIGFVEQIPNFTAATLLDECLTIDGAEKFMARKILFGLGFTDAELEKNPNHFSGGESAKISLAKALINEPRILILDEPTNHLDIYAIDFLEDFVKNYRGTVIFCRIALKKFWTWKIAAPRFIPATMKNLFGSRRSGARRSLKLTKSSRRKLQSLKILFGAIKFAPRLPNAPAVAKMFWLKWSDWKSRRQLQPPR